VETEANQTSGLSQPSPLQQESQKCQACGAAPEPGFPIPLCAKCRSQLARRPIPIGIKLAGVAIALLLVLAVTRIPSSISAAVAFERGQSAEQKLQFASAEREYQKTVVAYPKSELAHARLFIAAFRAKDGGVVRREFEFLRDRKLDLKLVGEIHALLGSRH
jgi:hypothetical protein